MGVALRRHSFPDSEIGAERDAVCPQQRKHLFRSEYDSKFCGTALRAGYFLHPITDPAAVEQACGLFGISLGCDLKYSFRKEASFPDKDRIDGADRDCVPQTMRVPDGMRIARLLYAMRIRQVLTREKNLLQFCKECVIIIL